MGMRAHLSVEGEGTGLALGADALWPGRVALTARLDLTADVLQGDKLPSGEHRGLNREVGVNLGLPEGSLGNLICGATHLSAPPVSLRM